MAVGGLCVPHEPRDLAGPFRPRRVWPGAAAPAGPAVCGRRALPSAFPVDGPGAVCAQPVSCAAARRARPQDPRIESNSRAGSIAQGLWG